MCFVALGSYCMHKHDRVSTVDYLQTVVYPGHGHELYEDWRMRVRWLPDKSTDFHPILKHVLITANARDDKSPVTPQRHSMGGGSGKWTMLTGR